MLGRMRDRNMRTGGAGLFEKRLSLAGDVQRRNALVIRQDLDIVPGYLSPPTGLQRFQKRFFRSEASGIRLCCRGAFRITVCAFGVGKNAFSKTRCSRHGFGDAINFDNVDTDRDDHKEVMSDEGRVISKSNSSTSSLGDEQILTDAGFHWRERDGVRILVCDALERAGFTNAFSTRLGGVSPFPENDLNLAGFDEDSAANIEENRRRFLSAFDGDFRLATVWQVHGDNIKLVADESDVDTSNQKFDALVSALPNVLVGVKTADCVPVLLGDSRNGAFAAVHAGWRGTLESIVAKTVERMGEIFGSRPKDLVCAIGPAACGRNYEIGQDVIDGFKNNFPSSEKYFSPTREGHALVDLHLANKDQLLEKGVPEESIFTSPLCTMERTDLFFSYRVEKKKYGKTGRLLSVIGRLKNGKW